MAIDPVPARIFFGSPRQYTSPISRHRLEATLERWLQFGLVCAAVVRSSCFGPDPEAESAKPGARAESQELKSWPGV
jgi:hypothetical protein